MGLRLLFIRLGVTGILGLILLRCLQIMVFQHGDYVVLAQNQHILGTQLTPLRGEIYTSDGYKLVGNAPTVLMFAVPLKMQDKDLIVDQIFNTALPLIDSQDISYLKIEITPQVTITPTPEKIYLPLSLHELKVIMPKYEDIDDFKKHLKEALTEVLTDNSNQYVQIFTKLSLSEREIFEDLKINGIYFEESSQRIYPEGALGAHIVGFVGKDDQGNDEGYFGLEGYYNQYLSGRGGFAFAERDVEGKPIPVGISRTFAASNGRDMVLTIRRELQYILEKKLKEGVEKYKAQNGAAIIMDPYSGAVWAMASYPTFYPQYWHELLGSESDVSKVSAFRNQAIASSYEPGSVMKPVTISMALNEKIIDPTTIFHDTGPVEYSGFFVRTWNNKYAGDITMTKILQLSNNTGAAWVGHQVGMKKFNNYFNEFNFGSVLGIDLEGEAAGIVREQSDLRDIDLANMSFGQGVSTTALQMATAYTALVNGGELYRPYVVKQIIEHQKDGSVRASERLPKRISSPISDSASEQIRYMMQKVVTNGEFKWFVKQAGMDKYSIGGKTGTAQIPLHGGYDPSKTITTFIGFMPVEEPQFVMLMKLNEPTTSTYSADTVVPMWMETARELVSIFGIPLGN